MTGKLFEWSVDKIRWYHDAEEYPENNRNRLLAQAVLARLGRAPRICEFGCGIGGLSRELSKGAERVTAIDSCEWTMRFMMQTLLDEKIRNVDVIQGDFTLEKPREKSDCVVMCMTGSLSRQLEYARRWTDRSVFYITETPVSPGFGIRPKSEGKPGPESVRRYLNSEGERFEHEIIKTRADQPLRSWEDAFKFCRIYNPEMSAGKIESYLGERLTERKCGDFNYLLPCGREYVMFEVFAR